MSDSSPCHCARARVALAWPTCPCIQGLMTYSTPKWLGSHIRTLGRFDIDVSPALEKLGLWPLGSSYSRAAAAQSVCTKSPGASTRS